MSLTLAGTSLNDLFSGSIARLQNRRWSAADVDPAADVDTYAQLLVKACSDVKKVPISLTTTAPYDLFKSQLPYLSDRRWDNSPGGLQEFSEAVFAVVSSGVPIGIDPLSTSLYALFRHGIAWLGQRGWIGDVAAFSDEVVNVLSSNKIITVVERPTSANDTVTLSESVTAVRT